MVCGLYINHINNIFKGEKMYSTVLGVVREDGADNWCYCHNIENTVNVSKLLVLKYNEFEKASKLIESDIDYIHDLEVSYSKPISKQKAFRSIKDLTKQLKDEVQNFFIFDEYDGWILTKKKSRLSNYKER